MGYILAGILFVVIVSFNYFLCDLLKIHESEKGLRSIVSLVGTLFSAYIVCLVFKVF